jgi:hypothetical protein
LSAHNLLNPKVRYALGDSSTGQVLEQDLTIKDYKRGTGFSLSLNYTF